MKKCIAVYLRLSLEDVDKRTNKAKDESNSIDAQRKLIQHHIEMNPYLAGLPQMEFCDDGYTGTNFERPDFQRMIDMIRSNDIQIVIVKDLSRFGRDYLEVGDYLEHIFPFLGVRMIAVNDHYDSEKNLGNTAGMDVAFRNLIYDYYSKDLSKKVKTAMHLKQKTGYVTSCPFGYKVLPGQKHKMVIDQAAAPVVRRIFDDVIAGKATSQIARELNAEGIPTPLEHKGIKRKTSASKKSMWTHTAIHSIIKNQKYTGCMINHLRESRKIRDQNQRRVPRNEWIIHEDAHEAIVSKEEFELAQAALRQVRPHLKKAPENVFPLYCAHCGRKLQKTFGLDMHFYCLTAYWNDGDTPCRDVRWDKTDLESVVLESLKAQIAVMTAEARKSSSVSANKETVLRKRLKVLMDEWNGMDGKKVQSYLDYREGRITKDNFINLRLEREKRSAVLQKEIAQTEAELDACMQEQERKAKETAVATQANVMSEDALKANLYEAVERINVTDERNIEIVWKFDNLFGTA